MQRSAKTQYANLAVLELAVRYDSPEPVRMRTIAQQQGIPAQFLVQIMLQLKHAGLVRSSRGAGGGYRLAKHPSDITLSEVITAVQGEEARDQGPPDNPVARALDEAWQTVASAEREILETTTFDQLAAAALHQSADMYYI